MLTGQLLHALPHACHHVGPALRAWGERTRRLCDNVETSVFRVVLLPRQAIGLTIVHFAERAILDNAEPWRPWRRGSRPFREHAELDLIRAHPTGNPSGPSVR